MLIPEIRSLRYAKEKNVKGAKSPFDNSAVIPGERSEGRGSMTKGDTLAHGSPSLAAARLAGDDRLPPARGSFQTASEAAPEGSDDVWTWTGIGADSKLIVSCFRI